MSKFIFLGGLVLLAIGCGSEPPAKNNPEPPKLTQQQLDAMTPEAAKHAKGMSDYAKAQQEMNKGRIGTAGPTGR